MQVDSHNSTLRGRAGIRWGRHVLTAAVFGALYVTLDYTAVSVQIAPGVSAWYPPSALALVLLVGVSLWYAPCVFLVGLAAAVINYHQSPFSAFTIVQTADVSIGYLLAAFIIRKFLRMDRMFHNVRDFGWYAGIVALAAGLVAALGVECIVFFRPAEPIAYWNAVFNWWVGDTVALLSVAPFLFLSVLPRLRTWLGMKSNLQPVLWLEPALISEKARGWRRTLIAAQFASVGVTLWIVFDTGRNGHYGLFYLCFVPVVWIAASGGAGRSAIGLVLVNSGAIAGILLSRSVLFSFSELQLLMLVISVTGMSLGAAVDESSGNANKLLTSTTYLNALIDNSPLAIISYDNSGKISMANPAFERLFGYPQADIVGLALARLITPTEFEAEAAEIMRNTGVGISTHTTTRRVRRTGEPVVVELYGVPLFTNGSVKGGYEIYKDITNQKKLEEELALSQKLQAVGRLAGGVAHDFNNILGVVQGYSEYMVEQLPPTDPMRESAEEILHSAHRGSDLVRQLLSFSRKQEIEHVVLDLNGVMSNVQLLIRRLIGEDIELTVRLNPDLEKIKANSGQIEQIVLNLAVNARDAMPGGGSIAIETANSMLKVDDSSPAQPHVMLLFQDSGSGMSPETLSHIFEPFFTTKEKGKGTGLGLSTVYGIVEQSGGQVRVESAVGHGTTFRLYFPSVKSPVDSRKQEEEPPQSTNGHETILLVEDQDEFRRMTGGYLKRHGYNVLIARNANEAMHISKTRVEPIDLLLSDVVMPGLRGPQLAKILAESRPTMAVLFMSGYTDGSLEDAAEPSRTYELISKPFTWNALSARIREVLETSRSGGKLSLTER
jgi:two-component system cell cycle sensor histidine kinase/response regulator CckA